MRTTGAATRRELTAALAERYQAGGAKEKGRILDRFVALADYDRNHAIRILGGTRPKLVKPRGRRCVYEQAVTEAIPLGEGLDRVCGKRLKALIPLLVPALERRGRSATGPPQDVFRGPAADPAAPCQGAAQARGSSGSSRLSAGAGHAKTRCSFFTACCRRSTQARFLTRGRTIYVRRPCRCSAAPSGDSRQR